jgi:hypothetical protein
MGELFLASAFISAGRAAEVGSEAHISEQAELAAVPDLISGGYDFLRFETVS